MSRKELQKMTEHKNEASGAWAKRPLAEQMANVGSEVIRAITWKNKKNAAYATLAFYRALELADLSLDCNHRPSAIREIARMREALVDYFAGENIYGSSDKNWISYFNAFTWAAAMRRYKTTRKLNPSHCTRTKPFPSNI